MGARQIKATPAVQPLQQGLTNREIAEYQASLAQQKEAEIANGTAPPLLYDMPVAVPREHSADEIPGFDNFPEADTLVQAPAYSGPSTQAALQAVPKTLDTPISEVSSDPNVITQAPMAKQPPEPAPKAPSTRQELAEQHAPRQYSDLADIFSGKAPESSRVLNPILDPIGDAIRAKESMLAKMQPAVAPEPINVTVQMPELRRGYRVTKNFLFFFEGGKTQYLVDDVITEQWVIDQVLRDRPGFITDDEDFVAARTIDCPNCKHLIKLP